MYLENVVKYAADNIKPSSTPASFHNTQMSEMSLHQDDQLQLRHQYLHPMYNILNMELHSNVTHIRQ